MPCNINLPLRQCVHVFLLHNSERVSVSMFPIPMGALLSGLHGNDAVTGDGPPVITSESSWPKPPRCAELPAGRRRRVR